MTLVLLLLLQQDPDQALRDFEKAWTARSDDSSRAGAITSVSICRSDKILDSLIAKLKNAKNEILFEALVKGIREYRNAKAVDALYGLLKDCEKKPAVFQAVMEGIGMGEKHSRPRVKELHKYLKSYSDNVQVPVIRALGRIRHKSSVEPLIERLKKAQHDMRDYIAGAKLAGCDGG